MPADALKRFLDSTVINYEQWHDGIGYDLDALAGTQGADRRQAVAWLRNRLTSSTADWRDAEAALHIREATLVELARRHGDPEVRKVVATPAGRRRDVLAILKRRDDSSATLSALHDIEEKPDPEVRATLLWCTLHSPGVVAFHAAAKLLRTYAGMKDLWDERPFLLQFTEPATRRAAYAELLRRIDPTQ